MYKEINATDLDNIFLDVFSDEDIKEENNNYIIDTDGIDIDKLDKKERKLFPYGLHIKQFIELLNYNGLKYINFNSDEKTLYKRYFEIAYNDCIEAGIPIEKLGDIRLIEMYDVEKDDPKTCMYTTQREIDDTGEYIYKLCCFKSAINDMIKILHSKKAIQMFFAHELIHTATSIEENHGPNFVNYVNRIIEYGYKKYGNANIYQYMFNSFEKD